MKKYVWLLGAMMYVPCSLAEPYLYYCTDFTHTHWKGIILSSTHQPIPVWLSMFDITPTPANANTFTVETKVYYNGAEYRTLGQCEQNDGRRAHHFVFEVPTLHLDIGAHEYLTEENPDGKNLLSNLTGQGWMKHNTLQNFYAGQLLLENG